ncbi:ABC transporter ATP-binding protein [Glutamicibacter mysorens]|uniref:ABC transporter ATP-binding protein n=1 Tax=Glutamicibacter mysorens TaxID=257984 RepID=UPI0011F3E374|nr:MULTISPECIES: ABC transporter ATP-binding protein [Glutamicibacter]QEP07958.1 ABC transporter ATP-binding protein [Glutamicibacter sp. ZJUTW]UTM46485.1 ABC transporter ATP-binding protein/permease [Glutamicibacter mysorens]
MAQAQPNGSNDPVPLTATLKRLAPFVKPIFPRLFCGFLCALGAGIVALAIPQVLAWLVNVVLQRDGAASEVWISVGIIAALGFVEALLIFLRRQFVLNPAAGLEAQMRIRFYKHLQRLPVAFHERWGSGQLLSRSMSDLSLLRRWLAFGAMMLVVETVTVVTGLVLMFTHSWILGLLYLLGSIPIAIKAYRFRNDYRAASRRSQDQAGDLATAVEESVHGIRVIKAFGRGPHVYEGFNAQAKSLQETEITKAKTLASFLLTVVAVPETILGIGLVIGLAQVANGTLSVGSLVAYFAIAAVIAGPVEGMGMLLGMTLSTKTALDRHFEVMDSINDIASPAQPQIPAERDGSVKLEHVRFAYPDTAGTHRPILADINLEIRPGETMALVGITGSGKSTLLNLVPRLHEATAGKVLVHGQDVKDWDLEQLRAEIAVAFEDTTLFSTSIRGNVLLGAPEHLDERQREALLAEALDVAQAQFAYALPDGVDTLIGEEGLSLSGGQRQRIALARAIAARPSVLVLDDPLSALDVRTEELVTERLRDVLAGTTTLIVAHRPSTVMLADRVALLRDGRIDAVGSHTHLLSTNEHYRFVIASLDDEEQPATSEVSR